ncbi:sigma-54-dependent Fis family transcriptional regulator [Desulfosporosinus sp. BICA1-9]|uniref:sigma-54 interaction domain-containing protein n=1 Tax=Desulfosporosinus sp. BICA1-9 TaxID=1531958 RepID=UPI0005F1AE46|nr:sigma 54-interacting transcriptional regulator [Desulfosporosinus sp. BICA1-9]KJS46290.1 MAG: hypothetical protein VR66_26250 [Peptococcaceae bacterium BRH_c23]KJS86881.1 MAG: hypothetical protein JL57_15180 [Desulfosporosinus sp. BICA1-9]HBW37020.1 PAS domain-containing protein [Desulfosporosinus sp.]
MNRESLISFEQLIKVFDVSHDGIIVTDNHAKFLFVNQSASVYMGVPHKELVGMNASDLVKNGVYDRSIIMRSIESKKQETGLVHTKSQNIVVSTSNPIFDENNNVIMTITNVQAESMIDKYAAELKKERANATKYLSTLKYISSLNSDSKIIAESPQMKKILAYLAIAGRTNTTVLLLGESGTGKEVLSRVIHENSNRSNEPFIPVNCAAVPKELMESEFFGYDKGAFSGALQKGKPGFFEMAERGTLLLDEIGEMPLDIQSKFLRVLENKQYNRIGGTTILTTDVRLIAATNKDLEKKVLQGTFRADLYYRLNVLTVRIPPLRERKEDIVALAGLFLASFNNKYGTDAVLQQGLMDKFLNYNWPGNIRELKNMIERMVVTLSAGELELNDPIDARYPDSEIDKAPHLSVAQDHHGDLKSLLKKVEKEYILKVLEECEWKVLGAAERLGLHRSMLYRKMQSLNIERIGEKES